MAILNGGYNGDDEDNMEDTIPIELDPLVANVIMTPNSDVVPTDVIEFVTDGVTQAQYDAYGTTQGIGHLPTVDLDHTEN